ncbi:DUF1786 domain-containing protein [Desulfovibrio sp. OttesenSCG-928-G11]|nr:DUF1786 domain-containing protein [Desulfovibrio sp. OttesenSCG-928-G11]
MLVPRFPHIRESVLVVDLGIFTMRALLYVPGKGPQTQYGFLLPSPECTLNERIHNCTVNRRPLYMVGTCMGLTPVASLRAHREAGFQVCMHPDAAEAMTGDPSKLEDMGVDVQRKMPVNASHVQALDFDEYFWNTLCDMAELPRPRHTLISAADYGRPMDFDPKVGRSAILKAFFSNRDKAVDLSLPSMPGVDYYRSLLRIAAIRDSTGFPVFDFATAFIFGMLSLPEIEARAREEEVLLLHVGEHFLEACLVHDDKLYAFLELPFQGLFAENGIRAEEQVLLDIMRDYYSGRLGEAEVMARAGYIWRASDITLPASSDHGASSGHGSPGATAGPGGLCPIFSAGTRAGIMESHSRVMGLQMDSVMINCWGLLNAHDRYLSHRQD